MAVLKGKGVGKGRGKGASLIRGHPRDPRGLCGHPVALVLYRDDLTGELVPRMRCEACGIVYLPEAA